MFNLAWFCPLFLCFLLFDIINVIFILGSTLLVLNSQGFRLIYSILVFFFKLLLSGYPKKKEKEQRQDTQWMDYEHVHFCPTTSLHWILLLTLCFNFYQSWVYFIYHVKSIYCIKYVYRFLENYGKLHWGYRDSPHN